MNDSPAAAAYVKVFPSFGWLHLVSVVIARKETVRVRAAAANANPRFFIFGFVGYEFFCGHGCIEHVSRGGTMNFKISITRNATPSSAGFILLREAVIYEAIIWSSLPPAQTRPPCGRVCTRYDVNDTSINFVRQTTPKEPPDSRANEFEVFPIT